MKEKKARVEDALHATRAAVEEGIVPGGGVALIRAQACSTRSRSPADQKFGVNHPKRAIEEPLRQIAQNAGAEGSVVVEKVREGKDGFGFNAQTDTVRGPPQGRASSTRRRSSGPRSSSRRASETLRVLDEEPHRLAEVVGLGQKRALAVAKAWTAERAQRDVMVFLQARGASASLAIRVWKRYGAAAVDVVSRNPYLLSFDVSGVGFKTADRLAASLGIARDSPERLKAALFQALHDATEAGHVYTPAEELVGRAGGLLEVDVAALGMHARLLESVRMHSEPAGMSLRRRSRGSASSTRGACIWRRYGWRVARRSWQVRARNPCAASKTPSPSSSATSASLSLPNNGRRSPRRQLRPPRDHGRPRRRQDHDRARHPCRCSMRRRSRCGSRRRRGAPPSG
jgi:hypothetical protein